VAAVAESETGKSQREDRRPTPFAPRSRVAEGGGAAGTRRSVFILQNVSSSLFRRARLNLPPEVLIIKKS